MWQYETSAIGELTAASSSAETVGRRVLQAVDVSSIVSNEVARENPINLGGSRCIRHQIATRSVSLDIRWLVST